MSACLSWQRAEAVHQVRADGGGVGDERRLQQRDGRVRGSAGDRIPAERAGVRTGRPGHHVRARAGHAERQARRNPLGDVDDVGLESDVIGGEHLPCPPHARLHLVDHQQYPVPRRQLAQPLQERRRRDDVAPLALNRLDDDRRDLVGRDEVHEQLLL